MCLSHQLLWMPRLTSLLSLPVRVNRSRAPVIKAFPQRKGAWEANSSTLWEGNEAQGPLMNNESPTTCYGPGVMIMTWQVLGI